MPAISYRELVGGAADGRDFVSVERDRDRAIIRLDDPDKLNVLSGPLMLQLRERCEELARDPDVRSIVLTGKGSAFSTGGDLRMMQTAIDQFGDDDDDEGATLPWYALPIAKPLLRSAADASWEQSLTTEEFAEPMCFTTRGFADGVAAVRAATEGRG